MSNLKSARANNSSTEAFDARNLTNFFSLVHWRTNWKFGDHFIWRKQSKVLWIADRYLSLPSPLHQVVWYTINSELYLSSDHYFSACNTRTFGVCITEIFALKVKKRANSDNNECYRYWYSHHKCFHLKCIENAPPPHCAFTSGDH